jgi:site-specific DNA-methyltransferase (adenine-specific)
LEYIPIGDLVPHPDNPRLTLREDVVAQLAAEIERVRFGAQHAILVRPLGDKYQIVSGHHRVEAASRAGVDVAPAWVNEDMDDDEAFMQLVLSNSQGELSSLEIGMHALKAVPLGKRGRGNLGGIADYSRRIGWSDDSVRQWRAAAEVASENPDTCRDFTDRARNLFEISKARREVWHLLVDALKSKEWTVAQTAAAVGRVGEFASHLTSDNASWLPMVDVIAKHLAQPERFTPTTVTRLLNAAAQVDDWISSSGTSADANAFDSWLTDNSGGDSWDYRKIINYRAELVAAAAAKADAEKTTAKLEVPDWHLGSWETHIDNLSDGSVSLLLTDPPYGMDYQSDYRVDRTVEHRHEVLEGDSNLADAMATLCDCAERMHPKLAEDAHLLVFCTARTEPVTRNALEEAGYTFRSSLIWVKNNTGMGDPSTTFAPKHERIMHYVKGSPKLLRREPDVLEADRIKTDRHPTEKPVDLLERLIEACTSRGQRIADPFAGVASTCVAAKSTGRTWWGCEINETYWRHGEERLS